MEIVAGVVDHAAARPVAIADQQVAAGAVFQHHGEVLAAVERGAVQRDVVRAEQLQRHAAGEVGFGQGVDQHRVVALVVHLGAHAEAFRLRHCQRADAPLQQVAHAGVERAHAQLQRRPVRDHVAGAAGVQRTDGDHRHLLRIDVARHDGLQRHHQTGRGDDRVGGELRRRAVAARGVQRDRHVVAGGQRRAVAQHEPALRDAGHVVHREDGVAGKALEQALLDHQLCAAGVFLGGLEDQVQRAGEVDVVREVVRRGEQHRRVAIVAAGVHDAVVRAGPRLAAGFLDRQRVHVGAQAEPARAAAARQLADDAGGRQPAVHGVAPGFQPLGDDLRGAVFGQAEFGVAVQVAAQRDERVGLRLQCGEHGVRGHRHGRRHGHGPVGWCSNVAAEAVISAGLAAKRGSSCASA